MDRSLAQKAIADFLRALGREPGDGTEEAPELVARAWCEELLAGEGQDVTALITAGLCPNGDRQQSQAGSNLIVLRQMDVAMMCPHHLLPSEGTADLVIEPDDKLIGFGSLSRALHAQCQRLILQEDAATAFRDAVMAAMAPRGVVLRLRMRHACWRIRGAREPRGVVETLTVGGYTAGSPGLEMAMQTLQSQAGTA